jgi:hypothetical protein
MEQRFRVFTNHNIAFLPRILLLFLRVAILPKCNRDEVRPEKGDQIKRREKLERGGKKGIEEKEKRRKGKRIHDQDGNIPCRRVCAKKANQTPQSPDPSLQLNVACGEAQRCAFFAHPCWKIIYHRLLSHA